GTPPDHDVKLPIFASKSTGGPAFVGGPLASQVIFSVGLAASSNPSCVGFHSGVCGLPPSCTRWMATALVAATYSCALGWVMIAGICLALPNTSGLSVSINFGLV